MKVLVIITSVFILSCNGKVDFKEGKTFKVERNTDIDTTLEKRVVKPSVKFN